MVALYGLTLGGSDQYATQLAAALKSLGGNSPFDANGKLTSTWTNTQKAQVSAAVSGSSLAPRTQLAQNLATPETRSAAKARQMELLDQGGVSPIRLQVSPSGAGVIPSHVSTQIGPSG